MGLKKKTPVSRLNFSGHDASYKLGMMGRVNNDIDISVQMLH